MRKDARLDFSDARGRSLNRDHNAPPDLEDDDLDSESHAADEPTAVWDESALRAAGLTDLLQRREAPAAPPATRAAPSGSDPSIVIDEAVAPELLNESVTPGPGIPEPVAAVVPASVRPRGLTWGSTVLVALVLGGLVYLLVRIMRD